MSAPVAYANVGNSAYGINHNVRGLHPYGYAVAAPVAYSASLAAPLSYAAAAPVAYSAPFTHSSPLAYAAAPVARVAASLSYPAYF